MLTYWHSLRYACCSVYFRSGNNYITIPDSYQMGITIFASVLIWCIDGKVVGPHAWNVRAILLTSHVVMVSVRNATLYSLILFFAKLALFLLYYRLFAHNRWTRIAIYLGITLNGLFYVASVVAMMVLCIPRRGESWTSITYTTRCVHSKAMNDVFGIFGLLSDLYIFILPLPILFRLQMSLRKKLGITAIFLTGLM